jgi:hypothetical protein
MPTVPRRVQTTALPAVRISPSAPAEAFQSTTRLPDLSRATGVAAQLLDEERDRADQVALLDADNQLSELGTQLQTETLAMRGRDAMGARQRAQEGWTKGASEIENGLASDRQKLAFKRRAQARWSALHETVERHSANEAQQYDVQQTTSALQNRLSDAVAHYQDPARVTQALAEQRAILTDHARRVGMSPETLTEKLATVTSATHTGVIDRMLTAGDDRAASTYYAAHKADIQGDDQLKIDRALEVGSTLGESQRRADDIIGRAGITRTAAFELARGIDDPKVRQATEQRLDTEFSRRDRAERDDYEQLQESAMTYVERGRMPPASVLSSLKASDRVTIRKLLQKSAEGTPVHTDQRTLYGLMLAAGDTDPKKRAEFANTNLLQYRDRLSAQDFEQIAREQVKARKGEAPSDEPAGLVTTNSMLLHAIQRSGVKKGSDDELALQQKVDVAVREQRRATGKKELSADETQDIIAKVVTRHFYVDRVGPDLQKRGGELTEDERGRAYVPLDKIPTAEAARIRQIMAARGKPSPSTRDIERAYAAALLNDLDGFDDAVSGVTYTGPR